MGHSHAVHAVLAMCLPGQRVLSDGALRLPRDGQKLVLWNYAIAGTPRDTNLYGSHPFSLQVNQG